MLVDLGMLADIDSACKAWRTFEKALAAEGSVRLNLPDAIALGKAMRRLDRVNKHYGRKLRAAGKVGARQLNVAMKKIDLYDKLDYGPRR